MKITEKYVVDAAASEVPTRAYYTMAETEELVYNIMALYEERFKKVVDRKDTDIYYLKEKVGRLEATIEELEGLVKLYIQPMITERKRAALERLNNGTYDIEDEDEKNFENLDENC